MSTAVLLTCPDTMRGHVQKVLDGEYDIAGIPEPKVILDIGANVGSFAVWAHLRWPKAHIHCYEPSKENYELLAKNVDFATLHPKAVTGTSDPLLYHGPNNCGEHSIILAYNSEDYEVVKSLPPSFLPPAQFLKIDTEGCEVEILKGYRHWHEVIAVALEWHSQEDLFTICGLLASKGFIGKGEPWATTRGVIKAWRQ